MPVLAAGDWLLGVQGDHCYGDWLMLASAGEDAGSAGISVFANVAILHRNVGTNIWGPYVVPLSGLAGRGTGAGTGEYLAELLGHASCWAGDC